MVAGGESLDVARVVEETVALENDVGRVELAGALEADPTRRSRERLPVGTLQAPVRRRDADAAVDHGDQVREGDHVQDLARPRPVDAAEEDVAVGCLGEARLFADAQLERLDLGLSRGGTRRERLCEDGDLRLANVLTTRVQEPVQVVLLDRVEVD